MADDFDLSLTGFEDIELEELLAESSEDQLGNGPVGRRQRLACGAGLS